jgi:ribonuclease J
MKISSHLSKNYLVQSFIKLFLRLSISISDSLFSGSSLLGENMKQQNKRKMLPGERRKNDTIDRTLRAYRSTITTTKPATAETLRIVPLGGQQGIGEKNMVVLEYGNDAVILDCGFELGIDLPGINYAIPATDYLATIQHKLRGYVISHGHMDHIGALVHVVPQYPVPIFGSRFTIGMVQAQFEKAQDSGLVYQPDCRVLDMDKHERITLGSLTIELVRVTHSVPESSAIVVDTPAGRVINTGDFRLDPEPLDKLPSDIARLRQLGDEGVLLLMSESTNTTRPGRTPTEHTLQDSFYELINNAQGRVFVAVFSTNMNRVQMIINAAATHGRKVAFDGRSMMAVAELAVRLGNLKIPKDTLITMRETAGLSDDELVVICTGGQGEPGAAMSRMAAGEHQYIKLKRGDSVVISSTPIPGNEQSYQQIGDYLAGIGVRQFRHPTHEIDGCGPLHVSGHGARDEHAEMIRLTQPQYLMPIYGGALNRQYHQQVGLQAGLTRQRIIMADNGDVLEFRSKAAPRVTSKVTTGALLVDQTGAVVPELVTKDRLLLRDDGFVVLILTVSTRTGQLLASPDIITRGLIAVQTNPELMADLRQRVRGLAAQHKITRQTLDSMKQILRDATASYLSERTGHLPIIIPVVNLVGIQRAAQPGLQSTSRQD